MHYEFGRKSMHPSKHSLARENSSTSGLERRIFENKVVFKRTREHEI